MDTQPTACALWNAAHHYGRHGLELEFRVGHMMGRSFVSNVGKAHFDLCATYLKQHCDAVKSVKTTETVQGDTKHVVTHHCDGQPVPPPFVMTKKRMYHTEFSGKPCTVRSSIAIEHILSESTLPQPPPGKNHTTTTRQKDRTRYLVGPWAFDLTVVVSNADLDSEETFEIELELLDTMVLFEYTMDHIVQWGLNLIGGVLSSCLQNKFVAQQ